MWGGLQRKEEKVKESTKPPPDATNLTHSMQNSSTPACSDAYQHSVNSSLKVYKPIKTIRRQGVNLSDLTSSTQTLVEIKDQFDPT